MMVDAVEAATKSLKDHSEASINEMVERIIDAQIAGGAFKNAPITFRNVEEVKEVLKSKLKSIYHVRISYPTLNVDKK
jgi:membrane-associated HD superfamily phosphohydrolase